GVRAPVRPRALAPDQVREPVRARLGRYALHVEIDEDGDLGAQDRWVKWLGEVVNGSERVALEDVAWLLADRSQEDDGDVPARFPLPDAGSGTEAVQSRHLDVQQDDREIIVQQSLEGFLPRVSHHQLVAQ